MERWLTQSPVGGSRRQSGSVRRVCANIEFPFPRRLVGDAVAAASGIYPDDDRWPSERARGASG
jgi:exodeoxyribonuclease V gamma subunit